MDKISIVVPCYNEEEVLNIFYEEVTKTLKKMKVDYELILVNDGSKDKTLDIMKELAKDKSIKYISFSRNFGKEAAMLAGFKATTGDYIGIMDVDLQDPPYLLEEMYSTLKTTDFDCVGSRRVTRKGEPIIRSWFAKKYYKIINSISKVEHVSGARDFRLMTRQMLDAFLELKEKNRYTKGLFSFVGFKTKWLEYENVERVAGITKWNFWRLFLYAMEGITSFSVVPLMISIIFGLIFLLVSLILLIVSLFTYFYTLNIILIILFLIAGIQLICLGVVSVYFSKPYIESRNRPIYIIKSTNVKNMELVE